MINSVTAKGANKRGELYKVYCNEEELFGVIAVNLKKGIAVAFEYDSRGHPMIWGNRFKRKIVRGKMRVERIV